jgi:EAL domain-containing protein (putative c-di-GMP-specific phosphodiesterase class I)
MKTIEPHTNKTQGRLLVVDDDLVQRTIIGKLGAKLGYQAVVAPTFEAASELLRTEKFDIMTLDLSLGERDGVELLRLIADLKLNAMPIVVISGCEERILNTTRRVGQALEPEFGILSPAIFIPLVERFGLMPELTNRILSSAIADSRKLIEKHPGFTIAVNVSGSLLTDLMLPERIEGILREERVAPQSLIVEVTESVAMSDVDRAMDILVRLRIKGVGAAIDDFGTGFSSLAALARLPFSELKIDQSFVKGCETDEDMMKIVEASIGLASAFRMKVVAEGIDNAHTLARVRQAGCDIGQGYLFAPSLRLERVERWLAQQESLNAAGPSPMIEQPRLMTPRAAR